MADSRRAAGGERLLIVGWDGADWSILDDLMARGCLPYLSSLVESGAKGVLESVIPTHSWAAWPTFLTGKTPAGHGVFDFVERDPSRPGRRVPVTSRSIRATTWPEYLSEAGREVRVGNVPVLFPPLPVKGRVISGVAVPPGAEFVHPREWRRELDRRAPFPINGLEWVRFENDRQALVDEAHSYLERRTAGFEVFLEGDWDVAACIYVEPDRLQHAFGAYLMSSHPDYPELSETSLAHALREVYRSLDSFTARLVEAAGPNTTTVLMSDHGFRPVNRQLRLSELLSHLGFAGGARHARATTAVRRSSLLRPLKRSRLGRLARRRVKMPSTVDWSRTRAYWATTGGGISLNLKGREPDGIVEPRDYDKVREELRTALLEFEDPASGQRPIAGVARREELYDGPFLDSAPDLFVRAADLWSMSGGTKSTGITASTDWPTGRHRRAGIVVAHGGRTERGDLGTKSLADLAPTALSFCGLRVDDLDGSPIEAISGDGAAELVASGGPGRRDGDLSAQEEDQITQHLRDLGYIE